MVATTLDEFLEPKTAEEKTDYSDMAIKDIAKLIRADLKETYGNTIKFSVTSSNNPRSIDVQIKAIHENYFMDKDDFKEYMYCSYLYDENDYNTYLSAYETKEYKKCHIKEDVYENIHQTINKYNYDNSDPMTDYFDVNYYEHWDFYWKGFEIIQ